MLDLMILAHLYPFIVLSCARTSDSESLVCLCAIAVMTFRALI